MERAGTYLVFLIFSSVYVPLKAQTLSNDLQRLGQEVDSGYIVIEQDPALLSSFSNDDSAETIFYHSSKRTDIHIFPVNFLNTKYTGERIHPQYKWKFNKNLESLEINYGGTLSIATSKRISSSGLEILSSYNNSYVVRISDYKTLRSVITHPAVYFISKESVNLSLETEVDDMNLFSNTISLLHSKYPSIDGSGMTVSIKENLFDFEDIDLINRYRPNSTAQKTIDNHATEMATIIGGAGNSFLTGKGVARAVTFTPGDFSTLFPPSSSAYSALDFYVQNHSYGTEVENFYGNFASAFDQTVWENPEVLHVFSAGNEGNSTQEEGSYARIEGAASITGNFKQAKNVLVVGSADTTGRKVGFVSEGPAYDGRIKPELTAYSMTGSSNSAALVSGVSVLLQQFFLEEYGRLPVSHLLKSALIASAEDIEEQGPDFRTGYGMMDAFKAYSILEEGNFIEDSISSGEIKSYELYIPVDIQKVRIALSWHDRPAREGARKALIDDLDLRLYNQNRDVTYFPWVLDASPENIFLSAGKGDDSLNNNEVLEVVNPAEGNYIIQISHKNELTSDMAFSISFITESSDSIYWEYPSSGDYMPYDGKSGSYFQWNNTYPEGTSGNLSISYDNGLSWQTLKETIDLGKEHFRWEPEGAITGIAIARLEVEGKYYLSDRFAVGDPVTILSGFNCTDSVLFEWKKLAGHDRYKIRTLGEKYLREIDAIQNSFYLFSEANLNRQLLQIQPVDSEGNLLMPSRTFNYQEVENSCFLSGFMNTLAPDTGVRLSVNLSTLTFVEDVIFYRLNDFRKEINRSGKPHSQLVEFIQIDPPGGFNSYQVEVVLSSGARIASEEISIFYANPDEFYVFPNPVSTNVPLRAFMGDAEGAFLKLYDRNGKLIIAIYEVTDRDFINIRGINPGLYLYEIGNRSSTKTGRLIITPN